MKRIVKTVNGQEYIIEEFRSFPELISTNDSRTVNFTDDGEDSRKDRNNSFRGCSYEDAVKNLCYGWEDKEKIQRVADTVSKIERTMDVPKMSFKNDIVGYAPVVPLALQGVPQNMINTTRKPKKAKVINLIIEISASGGVTVEEKLDWGAKLIANIMNLEKSGYRVRIEIVKAHCREDKSYKVHAMKLLLKSENQPFDIKRMMFPLAHAGMQRRIAWDWYERLPEGQYIYGYGRPLHHQSEARRQEVAKEIIGDTKNGYFICCMDDIESVLKGVA